jgi:hypothetical protein
MGFSVWKSRRINDESNREAELMKKLIVVSASLVILALMTAEAFGRG